MVTQSDESFGEPVVASADDFDPIRFDITYSNPTYIYLVNWSESEIGGAEFEFMTTLPEGYDDASSFFNKQMVSAFSILSAIIFYSS